MKPKFVQLDLDQIEHGLAKELAVLNLSPKQITALRGITFQATKDALDYCQAALLATKEGLQFALRSYYRGKHSNVTELIGNERSSKPENDVALFLDALDFESGLVLWRIGEKARKPAKESD